MNFLERLLGNKSAKNAKERLQLVLIHDRTDLSPAALEALKDDLIAAISKHIDIDPSSVRIEVEHEGRAQRLIADIPLRVASRRRTGEKYLVAGAQHLDWKINMRGGFWRYFDFWLLGAVTILVIIGITMIRSALAGNIELTVTTPLVSRQIIFALIGFVLLLAAAGVDYRLWSSMSNTLYIGIIIVLIALNVIGAALFGSARWFRTTLVFIQPSEFAKLVIILSLSHFFVQHMHEMHEPKWTLRSLIMAMGITVWVILQPNLSTSIVLLVLWFILLWMAGVPIRHLVAYAITAVIILAIAFPILLQFQIIQDYQVKRILNFIIPDPTARYGDIYNIQQALISIGSGGLFGQGYGHGTQVQLRFLKVRWSDFIFSTSANELGFVGAVLIIGLTIFIVWRCLWAARVSRDTYGALISYGVATLIAFQAIVNIGVNLNLMPATGLTLPFVSYGGSSLVANMIAVGLVESVIMRHKALEL